MASSDATHGILALGIDTAGPADSVALTQDTQCLASFSLQQPASSFRPLLRLIDLVCTQVGCELADVAMLAVNTGPGAFTGIRVGLATALGLALAYNMPVVGCSTFEALVALVPSWHGLLCPVVTARKGEVYAALYRRDGERVQEEVPGMVIAPEALCTLVQERTLFLGSGVDVYGKTFATSLGDRAVCVNTHTAAPGLAGSIARVAYRRFQTTGVDAVAVPQPLYIRPADARLPRVAANAARDVSLSGALQAGGEPE